MNASHKSQDETKVLYVTEAIQILRDEFQFTFMRSSGPGGQNVNKVNSKVRLCWSLQESSTLPEDVKARFITKYKRRINSEGQFLLTSQRYRDQPKNIADCLEKLCALIVDVATIPKARKKKRPSFASKQKRLKRKKLHSQKKETRRKPPMEN
ncbi:Hypothetical protein YaeJ with similarity to translation release factor [hydrothermal vent metagenome]|uniref:Prokaryotic-type class I peptide chain release factors domain-containing protein n=1 Tax=hydrothermal vent metagenome TaxID=652676 RepID=A0A3B1DIK3_9ZZZZ